MTKEQLIKLNPYIKTGNGNGVLSFKHELTSDQFDSVVKSLHAQLSGRSDIPLVVGHEATYTPTGVSVCRLGDLVEAYGWCVVESDYLEVRRLLGIEL